MALVQNIDHRCEWSINHTAKGASGGEAGCTHLESVNIFVQRPKSHSYLYWCFGGYRALTGQDTSHEVTQGRAYVFGEVLLIAVVAPFTLKRFQDRDR